MGRPGAGEAVGEGCIISVCAGGWGGFEVRAAR